MNSKDMGTHPIVGRHPLWDKDVETAPAYEHWIELWHATNDMQTLISLLHCGFSLEDANWWRGNVMHNLFVHYLSVADGWREGIRRAYGGEIPCITSASCEKRTMIARKAFDMLCLGPFKRFVEDGGNGNLDHFHTAPFILPVLMDFFSERDRRGKLLTKNLAHGKSLPQYFAKRYLYALIDAIWRWDENTFVDSLRTKEDLEAKLDFDKAKRKIIDPAKVWSIEILYCQDKLHCLERYEELGSDAEAMLEELALRSVSSDGADREGDFLKALSANDSAAWFLHKYRTVSVTV